MSLRILLLAGVVVCSAPRIGVAGSGIPPTDPVGAYSILDQVVLEPTDAAPARIQMWGAFAVSATTPPGGYQHPTAGYMYYACPPGRADACKREWDDLKWIAGTGKAIGFGLRARPMGRLRRAGENVAAPDAYPIDGGLVKVESKDPNFTSLVAALKAALASRAYLMTRTFVASYLMTRTFVASSTYIPRP